MVVFVLWACNIALPTQGEHEWHEQELCVFLSLLSWCSGDQLHYSRLKTKEKGGEEEEGRKKRIKRGKKKKKELKEKKRKEK